MFTQNNTKYTELVEILIHCTYLIKTTPREMREMNAQILGLLKTLVVTIYFSVITTQLHLTLKLPKPNFSVGLVVQAQNVCIVVSNATKLLSVCIIVRTILTNKNYPSTSHVDSVVMVFKDIIVVTPSQYNIKHVTVSRSCYTGLNN